MINKNSIHHNKPFMLAPVGKDYLWGGNRLQSEYGKEIDMEPLAESWECSTHPDGVSSIASGVYQGQNLRQILELHPEYLGTHPDADGDLPIMVKFIDARKDLSLQVHPTDEYARTYEHGQRGKTEMWYVADAKKDASLIYGFYHDMSREQLEQSLQNDTVERYLQKIAVQKNDVFFIEAGTVHAIGAGSLIVEVQECSNLTYRMYDYNRVDKNGQKRELHVEKALQVANLKSSREPRQPMRVLRYKRGMASELLCRCKYFQVERNVLNTELAKNMVEVRTESNSFCVYVCLGGCGVIYMEDGDRLDFFKGDTIFVPADSVSMRMHGKAQLLRVTC
ncbi:MAG: class I mannose-6-phosphate isomerase [Lachnospiraceae bacterium]|nr:class I mannose-6-phosphate isomerase [Lachnospiraceae bacterium]